MRLVWMVVGSALLTGCVAPNDGLLCPESDLRYGDRMQMEIYLTGGDVHGNNLAVSVACPRNALMVEAQMGTNEEQRAFWNRLNSFEPARGFIPTGRAIVLGEVRLSPDGLETLRIYQALRLEEAYPPPQIATTLHLDPAGKPQ